MLVSSTRRRCVTVYWASRISLKIALTSSERITAQIHRQPLTGI